MSRHTLLTEMTTSTAATSVQTPHHFLCPITGEVMIDPVICLDGHSYDRTAITQWFSNHDTSPCTGLRLENKGLIQNIALREAIREFLESQPILRTQSEVFDCMNSPRITYYNRYEKKDIPLKVIPPELRNKMYDAALHFEDPVEFVVLGRKLWDSCCHNYDTHSNDKKILERYIEKMLESHAIHQIITLLEKDPRLSIQQNLLLALDLSVSESEKCLTLMKSLYPADLLNYHSYRTAISLSKNNNVDAHDLLQRFKEVVDFFGAYQEDSYGEKHEKDVDFYDSGRRQRSPEGLLTAGSFLFGARNILAQYSNIAAIQRFIAMINVGEICSIIDVVNIFKSFISNGEITTNRCVMESIWFVLYRMLQGDDETFPLGIQYPRSTARNNISLALTGPDGSALFSRTTHLNNSAPSILASSANGLPPRQ